MTDFLTLMTKDVGDGISNTFTVEGDEYIYVSFFQQGMNGEGVCDCVSKTNQEVTFMFNEDGSFRGVEGAIS